MEWNFTIPSGLFYGGQELYGMAEKMGISLKLFHHRVPNVFIGVFL